MHITALTPQRRQPQRVDVYVDGELRLELADDLVLEAGLHVGDAVEPGTLETLERRDLRWRARDSALRLLAVRTRGEAELRRRLRRKGFPEHVVDGCVADLLERRLLDDEAFADAFVRDRVRLRPRGSRRLVDELRAKGVDAAVAEAAVERVFRDESVSEEELAREAAAGWARRNVPGYAQGRAAPAADPEERRKQRRRLYAYLGRRGFGPDAVRAALEEVLGPAD